jgi:cell division septal protein FtsQ
VPPIVAGAVAVAVRGVWGRRRTRLVCIALVVLGLLLTGGWMFLRSSPLSAIRQVQVAGAGGPQGTAIANALTEAAHRMSTLSVSPAQLRSAVAQYPIVRGLRTYPSFPHRLRIVVEEQPPVAALSSGGERTAVAADGIVLGPAQLSSSLPALDVPAGSFTARRVTSPQLLAELSAIGAAPGVLRARIAGADEGARGLTVTMRNGLLIYFGDARLAHAKWLAVARVLADPSSRGATYLDVRLPSRPAAGGFASGTGPAASGAGGEQQGGGSVSAQEPTVEALAAALAGTSGAGSGPAASSSEPSESSSEGNGTGGEGAGEASSAAGGGEGEASAGTGESSG